MNSKSGREWTTLVLPKSRSVIFRQLELAGVKIVGFHDGEAIGFSVFHQHPRFPAGPLHHPVVGQISHKGGAENQDDGKTKEEDGLHSPVVHLRILAVPDSVFVLTELDFCLKLLCVSGHCHINFYFHVCNCFISDTIMSYYFDLINTFNKDCLVSL